MVVVYKKNNNRYDTINMLRDTLLMSVESIWWVAGGDGRERRLAAKWPSDQCSHRRCCSLCRTNVTCQPMSKSIYTRCLSCQSCSCCCRRRRRSSCCRIPHRHIRSIIIFICCCWSCCCRRRRSHSFGKNEKPDQFAQRSTKKAWCNFPYTMNTIVVINFWWHIYI